MTLNATRLRGLYLSNFLGELYIMGASSEEGSLLRALNMQRTPGMDFPENTILIEASVHHGKEQHGVSRLPAGLRLRPFPGTELTKIQ